MDHSTAGTCGGIDWGARAHAGCVVDAGGGVVDDFEVVHDAAGLAELIGRLRRAGVGRVAIERPDGPVVDALMAAGLDVVVVASRAVKAFRARYGSAGNKSDRSDAFVLADCLRSDGHRWASLQPDSLATVQLRRHVRTRRDLVATRVATANQLRAHLSGVFPGAVGLFSDLDSAISLAFLARYPSQERAAMLTPARFQAWLRARHYAGGRSGAELHARLRAAATGDGSDPDGTVTLALVGVLVALRAQIAALETAMARVLDAHPDGPIFRSLPRAGTVRAATLLAEIGDCRARFPDPHALTSLAGVTPSTRQSGRYHHVSFRYAADKKLRNALCDFAGDTMRANPWAEHRYRALRASGKTHPHAERILARSWAHIIWRLWQNHTPYNPAHHTALQHLTNPTPLT